MTGGVRPRRRREHGERDGGGSEGVERDRVERDDAERGAGTLLMAGLALLALVLIASVALLLQATSSASRAATAADLAALAAADAVRGITTGNPCGVAEEVAERHGAEVRECLLEDTGPGTALIRVVVPVPGVLPDARGAARAGPPS